MKEERSIPIKSNQVYKDDISGSLFELIYVDGNVYVAQNENGSHRLGKRFHFEDNVESGRYKLQEDADTIASTVSVDRGGEEIKFEELDNIGQSAAENLRSNGIITRQDVADSSDETILSISWVGEKGLDSIRDAM